jgi:Peptidase family S41
VGVFLYALAASSVQAATEARDWGAALRIDATALHDDIAANHPGPVNPSDAGFARRNNAQFAEALRRAKTAKSFADYFYAMRHYVASFNDGHLQFGVFGNTPEEYRWPGFLTRYDGDDQQRVFMRDDWGPVPIGARLIGCDGKSANRVSAEIVGSIMGRWNLLSQRKQLGFLTFTNRTDPYVRHPARCTFDVDGKTRTVKLDWRATSYSALFKNLPRNDHPRTIGIRTLANGARWLSLPSFNGDPASDASKALTAVLETLNRDGRAVRAAPAIVLDLRGNSGGSSDWSYQIAKHIWGEGAVAALPQNRETVTWRASPANLETIRAAYEGRLKSPQFSTEERRWFEEVIAGLGGAISAHKPVWEQSSDPAASSPHNDLPRYHLAGKVYLITDSSCMSACLDAVDLWRALGAIHVGQETSADTLYMEVREDKLPSGIGAISLPMKVYRGRKRGSNEPVIPQHVFHGDIDDTAALETWLASLG